MGMVDDGVRQSPFTRIVARLGAETCAQGTEFCEVLAEMPDIVEKRNHSISKIRKEVFSGT
jgi:chemotaxis response regulator CheB